MKKSFLLIALMASCIMGAHAQSELKVHLADNSRFNISVNGHYFNKHGQSITVGDLPPGRQHIKIFAMTNDRWGGAREETIYQGAVKTQYGMTTMFEYDPNTQMITVQETAMSDDHPHPMRHPYEGQGGYRDAGSNYPDHGTNTMNDAPRSDNAAASPAAEGKAPTLTESKRQALKANADGKATDTEKMTSLKNGLSNELITTYDVGKLMDCFIFESSKVDFATWAYSKTTDKEQYSDLADKLTTKDAKSDFDNFIKTR